MSADFEYMRTSISQSLLPVLKYNLLTQTAVNLFELGTVFKPNPNPNQLPLQPLELGLLSTSANFAVLCGQLEVIGSMLNLLLEVGLPENPHPGFHPSHQALIKLENKPVGLMAQTKNKQAWVLTLDVSALISQASASQQYPEVSGYPPIIEDLTFTLIPRTLLGPVLATIKSTNRLIARVELTKTYRQNHTFHLIYQSFQKPLTDDEVAPIRKKVVAALKTKFKSQLVGKL
jgi:phenylalanyl-tRNA synthetase beta subunit